MICLVLPGGYGLRCMWYICYRSLAVVILGEMLKVRIELECNYITLNRYKMTGF